MRVWSESRVGEGTVCEAQARWRIKHGSKHVQTHSIHLPLYTFNTPTPTLQPRACLLHIYTLSPLAATQHNTTPHHHQPTTPQALIAYFFGKELKDSGSGLVASALMAVVPGGWGGWKKCRYA